MRCAQTLVVLVSGCLSVLQAAAQEVAPSDQVPPAPGPAPPGTYGYKDVTIGGLMCGHSQNGRIYYPSNAGKVPLIVFAHGWHDTGNLAWQNYEPLLTRIAASGYVVAVFESGAFPVECERMWEDVCRTFGYMQKTSSLSKKVDWNMKTGITGHSMGGRAALELVQQSKYVKEHNVGAAFMYNPQYHKGTSLVPAFFATGSADSIVSPKTVEKEFTETKGVQKVFVEVAGAGHRLPWFNAPQYLLPHNIAFFDCHIKGKQNQCDLIYGKAKGDLCNGPVPVASCKAHSKHVAETVIEPILV